MPRTGRPRKLTGAQGHREQRGLSIVPSAMPTVIPRPPLTAKGEPLLPDVLLLWDAYWMADVSRAVDGPAGVDRAVVDDWIRLESELLAIEMLVQESGRLVDGSRGQVRPHPLLGERHSLRGELKVLREQLGIGPMNRARLGIDSGTAQMTAARLNEMLNERTRGAAVESPPAQAKRARRPRVIEGELA